MDVLPVNPLRTTSGALVSLLDALGSAAAATPVPLADSADPFANFQIVSDSLSLSAAATLGVGTIFKGQLSASEQAFYFDAMTYTDAFVDQGTNTDNQIVGTRWGVGLRILLRVERLDASASLNFGLVGAAVELGQARARYEILGPGLGRAFSDVLDDLPGIGSFDYATYLKLNGPIQKKVAAFIRNNRDQLVPQPVGVSLARSLDPVVSARGVYFAMNGLAGRLSLADTLRSLEPGVDRGTLERAYAAIAGPIPRDERPSRQAQDSARDWLNR